MSLYPDDYASGHNAVNIIDKFGSLKNQSRHSIVDESITMTAAISDDENDNSIRVNRTLNTVDSLTEDINSIANYMKQISSNHSAILSSFQNDDARKQNGEIQNKIKEISHRVTDELKVMKRMLERDEIGPDRDTANFRIRKAQYATLSRKFRDVMLEFNKIQEDYRDKNKEKIQRQLKIAGKDISEDKLEEILESENPQTFTDNILDVNILQKRKIVSEMETRHMEILSLEDSIRELHDMFYDLAQIVYDQDDLINQIQFNVDSAAVFVEHGTRVVNTASAYRRSSTRIKWIICIIVTVVTVIVVVVAVLLVGGIAVSLVTRQINNI